MTCGDNGEIKLWNYSNGHCIRILDKGLYIPHNTSWLEFRYSLLGNSLETSDVKFIALNDNK